MCSQYIWPHMKNDTFIYGRKVIRYQILMDFYHFFSILLPFLPAMQLFAYARSNTFYLGLTVIRYQILMGYYNFFLVWGLVTLVLWPTRFRRHRWKLTRSFFISSSIKFKLNFWYRNTFCSFLLNFFKL